MSEWLTQSLTDTDSDWFSDWLWVCQLNQSQWLTEWEAPDSFALRFNTVHTLNIEISISELLVILNTYKKMCKINTSAMCTPSSRASQPSTSWLVVTNFAATDAIKDPVMWLSMGRSPNDFSAESTSYIEHSWGHGVPNHVRTRGDQPPLHVQSQNGPLLLTRYATCQRARSPGWEILYWLNIYSTESSILSCYTSNEDANNIIAYVLSIYIVPAIFIPFLV